MMTEDITGRVVRIRRAFDAAFQRMCEAKNPEIAEDEGRRGWHHVNAHRDATEAARRVTQVSLSLLASRTRR